MCWITFRNSRKKFPKKFLKKLNNLNSNKMMIRIECLGMNNWQRAKRKSKRRKRRISNISRWSTQLTFRKFTFVKFVTIIQWYCQFIRWVIISWLIRVKRRKLELRIKLEGSSRRWYASTPGSMWLEKSRRRRPCLLDIPSKPNAAITQTGSTFRR